MLVLLCVSYCLINYVFLFGYAHNCPLTLFYKAKSEWRELSIFRNEYLRKKWYAGLCVHAPIIVNSQVVNFASLTSSILPLGLLVLKTTLVSIMSTKIVPNAQTRHGHIGTCFVCATVVLFKFAGLIFANMTKSTISRWNNFAQV